MNEQQYNFKQRVNGQIEELAFDIVDMHDASMAAIELMINKYTCWLLNELAEEFKLQARGMKG